MPNRKAIFHLGYLGYIDSFVKLSESKFEIKGRCFIRDEDQFIADDYDCMSKFIVEVDVSDVLNKEKALEEDESEGYLNSKIQVSVYLIEE